MPVFAVFTCITVFQGSPQTHFRQVMTAHRLWQIVAQWLAVVVENKVKGGVPETSHDRCIRENGTYISHVLVQLVQVFPVITLATLVVDDDNLPVGTADDAVGTHVLDTVLGPDAVTQRGDCALAIHLVGGVKPYSDAAQWVHDGSAHVFIDIGQAARVIVIVGDDAVFEMPLMTLCSLIPESMHELDA